MCAMWVINDDEGGQNAPCGNVTDDVQVVMMVVWVGHCVIPEVFTL